MVSCMAYRLSGDLSLILTNALGVLASSFTIGLCCVLCTVVPNDRRRVVRGYLLAADEWRNFFGKRGLGMHLVQVRARPLVWPAARGSTRGIMGQPTARGRRKISAADIVSGGT